MINRQHSIGSQGTEPPAANAAFTKAFALSILESLGSLMR
jgi:hypothetical protein